MAIFLHFQVSLQHMALFKNTCVLHKCSRSLINVTYDLLSSDLRNSTRYGLMGISYLDVSLLFITFFVLASTRTRSRFNTYTYFVTIKIIRCSSSEHNYNHISTDKSRWKCSLIPGKNVAYSLTCNRASLTFMSRHFREYVELPNLLLFLLFSPNSLVSIYGNDVQLFRSIHSHWRKFFTTLLSQT